MDLVLWNLFEFIVKAFTNPHEDSQAGRQAGRQTDSLMNRLNNFFGYYIPQLVTGIYLGIHGLSSL